MDDKTPVDMPADQRDLYAEFGIAAEKAQVLELEIGNVILAYLTMFVDKNKPITDAEREVYRAIFADVNSKTFGALVRLVRKVGEIDDSIIKIIAEALKRRNYLTHHFFRHHNFALFSDEGRQAMMSELREIEAKLDRAHQVAVAMSSILLRIAGRPEMDLEKIRELQARGKRLPI